MKKKKMKKMVLSMLTVACIAAMLGGCGINNSSDSNVVTQDDSRGTSNIRNNSLESANQTQYTELNVRFGDNGQAFTLHLLDNATAQAIANYVGTSDWRLPIYDRDKNMDYSVMEYYDIPKRYNIPADNMESVTQAKAGDVYYSEPNRIVLFYKDAAISEEYIKIGNFDATAEFISAVENNPVLEGWGNKIIQISRP